MILDINAYGNDPIEHDSILSALASERIVSFKKSGTGKFVIREECDAYYCGWLTKEQMILLSEEIKALAEDES
jgi:hypothetical protein